MRVSISVPGRLHAFYLAKFFQDKGVLHQIITGYPKFTVVKYGINKNKITSLYINEVINRLSFKILGSYKYDYEACEAFDWLNRYTINPHCDFYYIWSSYALNTIRYIKRVNPKAVIILVRGSAHIQEQQIILANQIVINKKIIDKEIAEYEEADYITVPSTFAKRTFLKYGIKEEKVFLNPLGVDLSSFKFIERNFNKEELIVGYVGTISARKNIKGIIEIIQALTDKGYKIRLLLVGPIEEESFDVKYLEKYFIDYHGYVPQNRLVDFYSKMHLFVLNTLEDGFAVVLLQAMATGLPVITTENSGGPDVVLDNENGFIIPINDNRALANRISWFYKNRNAMPKMSEQSLRIAKNKWTWDDFGQRHLDFIERIKNGQN